MLNLFKMKITHKITLIILIMSTTTLSAQNWKQTLSARLPYLGHRNWIVVVDAAYPAQTSPGIETILCNESQEEVVKGVVEELGKTKHVRPIVFLDKELQFVNEVNAPGISSYRDAITVILSNTNMEVLPHEKIISMLDEAGKTFKVILLKTRLTIPYTSVFFRLECGYWTDEAEKQLRDNMKEH
jgi:L-fucose mutarotase/ribose pyranase (RbsD/FucU family)